MLLSQNYHSNNRNLFFTVLEAGKYHIRAAADLVSGESLFLRTAVFLLCHIAEDFPGGEVVKHLPASAGDTRDSGLIPGLGRSPGGGHGDPLLYPCLENSMDRGTWWATVHGVTKSQTRLSTQHNNKQKKGHPSFLQSL